MSNELPPLPDDIEQAIYERSLEFVPQTVHRAIEQLMREYGRACERAAYGRAAQECREQAKFHAVHRDYRYDFKADGANECAAAIEALGADK